MTQTSFLPTRLKGQLLKWVGNKHRYADVIVSYFPERYNRYIEPFVGTGAVLATLSPRHAIASDTLTPLIEIWELVKNNPLKIIDYYKTVIRRFNKNRQQTYKRILDKYNKSPNGFDLTILSRTCYGGVFVLGRKGK